MTVANAVMPSLCDRRRRLHFTTALHLLQRQRVDLWRVSMLAVGEYENYNGEVRSQYPEPGAPLDHKSEIRLEIGMYSAVDQLPYQFFYGLEGKRPVGSGWELQARKLMAPFDAAVARYRAIAGFERIRFHMGFYDDDHLLRILDLFRFEFGEVAPSEEELRLWAMLLPSFHLWAGNTEAVAGVLGRLFGYRFAIRESVPSITDVPESLRAPLGRDKCHLGRSAVIGKSFSDCESAFDVQISSVPPDEVRSILQGGRIRRRIEWLLGIAMPSHLEYSIRIKVDSVSAALGKEQAGSRLGSCTYLSEATSPVLGA
ncbi:MAG: type VI secretion system baseplate subunit TssG [Candidatus Zixiibacteriota bacterium]